MYTPSPVVVPAHPCCLCDLIRLVSLTHHLRICSYFFFWEATDATVYYYLIQGFRPLIFHLALSLSKEVCVCRRVYAVLNTNDSLVWEGSVITADVISDAWSTVFIRRLRSTNVGDNPFVQMMTKANSTR